MLRGSAAALLILALAGGRLEAKPSPPAAGNVVRGLVYVVEGIGGFGGVNVSADRSLPRAGVPHEIRAFVWTHGRGKMFQDLQDHRYMQRKAQELAEEVLAYKKMHPERPVYLIGKSGGAGVVLGAAEYLPPATLERIVLLSPAVAADYDLRPALRVTRREIVAFYSVHDHLVLGWGTSHFGTIDRVYGPAAGWRGFVEPDGLGDADRLLYGRLVQIAWRPQMIFEGNFGNHLGTGMPAFVGKEVAPWLK